jgi:hypothetical protein
MPFFYIHLPGYLELGIFQDLIESKKSLKKNKYITKKNKTLVSSK